MAYALALAVVGAALLGAGFLRWRVGRRRGLVGLLLGLGLTLWLTELGLGAWEAVRPPSSVPERAPTWTPRALPKVAGHVVPEDLAASPSGRPTVLLVGDSFAAGQGVTSPETLGAQLGARLGEGARVLTLAAPGWNLDDELLMFGATGVRVEPDVLVWVFVYNDLGVGAHQADDLVLQRGWRRRWPVRLLDVAAQLDWNLTVHRATVAAYRQALDPASEGHRAAFADLARVAAAAREAGVRPVFAPYPLLHDLGAYPFDAEHAGLLAAAEAAGWDVVDLLPAFRGLDASTLWASRDDHHPNGTAHGLAADVLAAALGRPGSAAGRVDCALLPAPRGLGAPFAEACARGDAEALLGLAEAAVASAGGPLDGPFRAEARAPDLATVAVALALPESREHVLQRAVAVVEAVRAAAPRGPTD